MFTVRAANPEEFATAFALVFQHLAEEERRGRADTGLNLVNSGEIEPQGILVAESDGRLAGALVCVPLRGSSGLVWPPGVREGPARRQIEDQLTATALDWLRQRGAKLAQTLLPTEELVLAAPLERAGFQHVTQLVYMKQELGPEQGNRVSLDGLAFVPYSAADPLLFEQTLFHTYEQTLDCPELNGLRSAAEILAGHRAQGEFDPSRWWLVYERDVPVGVLLVTKVFGWNVWDLSYLGVVQEARGRGLGRQLAAKALSEARAAGMFRMTLAVDVRNQPARNLYLDMGFEPCDRREVYLHFYQ